MLFRKILRLAAVVLLAGAGVYAYHAAELYFFQEKHIYHPEKSWLATPEAEGMAYEDVALRSSDGVGLSAWYIPSERANGSVIFFHGNARNMSSDLDAVRLWHQFGYHVFIFDYRGYGKSEGSPSEEGMYRDAQAAWDWVVRVKKESPDRIVLCGRSLGAAVAADLASKHLPKALILEAAFTSLPEAGQDLYPYFPVKLLSKYRYDTLGKLKEVRCPVLLVHSRDDQLIPFRHAQMLYAAVGGKKELITLGGPHIGGYEPTLPKYHEGLRRFLKKLTLD